MRSCAKWWPWHRSHVEAQEELDRARQQLESVRRQWPAVHRAAESMREHYEENGFARKILLAMGVEEP